MWRERGEGEGVGVCVCVGGSDGGLGMASKCEPHSPWSSSRGVLQLLSTFGIYNAGPRGSPKHSVKHLGCSGAHVV